MADSFLAGLKRAFKWHWHLLALGAGTAIALLSGHPDIALPLLAAGELAYLGFLGSNRRFLNVLRGDALARERQAAELAARTKLQQTLSFLAPPDADRFRRLRQRCVEFDQLRQHLEPSTGRPVVSELRGESLEKMLWLFLRLLHHKSGIDRFLAQTDEAALRSQFAAAEQELAAATDAKRPERLVHSLAEKRDAIRSRLENHAAAVESRDLLVAELDKTEQRIEHINEVGMTSRAPDDLGIQIDSIAESMASSERALGDLRSTLLLEDEAPPPLLSGSLLGDSPPPLPLSE